MAGTTDTKKAKIPLGSFIMNYGSSRMYPELEPLARMFSADKDDMSKSTNAILTNGEIYFPPDAVEAIGVEKLEYMNNKSKDGAHDAIDKEMAMNLLKSIKPMYGGGMVNASPKPMQMGGMAEEYGHGGMVEDNLIGMRYGGKAKKKKKMYGYQDGGVVDYLSNYIPDMGDGKTGFQQIVQVPKDGGGFNYYLGDAEGPELKANQRLARKRAIEKIELAPQDSIPASLVDSYFSSVEPEKKKSGLMSLLGFQEGGMIGPPAPPMDDPLQIGMRQANPEMYTGQTLGAMGEAEALQQGIMQNEMIKKQAIEDTARKSLQLLRLEAMMADPSSEDKMGMMMADPSMQQFLNGASLDSLINAPIQSEGMQMPTINRDIEEMLNMEMMKRGREALMRGMMREGQEDPLEALR